MGEFIERSSVEHVPLHNSHKKQRRFTVNSNRSVLQSPKGSRSAFQSPWSDIKCVTTVAQNTYVAPTLLARARPQGVVSRSRTLCTRDENIDGLSVIPHHRRLQKSRSLSDFVAELSISEVVSNQDYTKKPTVLSLLQEKSKQLVSLAVPQDHQVSLFFLFFTICVRIFAHWSEL